MTNAALSQKTVQTAVVAAISLVGFVSISRAETMTWSGAADKLWSNPSNWTPGESAAGSKVPAAGDAVVIGSGKTVVLADTTPRLASVDLTGTLSFTNWTTRLDADSVVIKNKGKMTVACAFTENEMSNRVYVTCGSFDLQSGGSVNVDALGWKGLYGPGCGCKPTALGIAAASHGGSAGLSAPFGGRGTYRYVSQIGSTVKTYDSISEPLSPGSGCGPRETRFIDSRHGGGAVRIAASGHVSVNGSISATTGAAWAGAAGAASGGSVYISCATVEGTGSVNVAGGTPAYSGDTVSGGGGGGRIALVWSDANGQKAYSPNLTFNCGGTCGQRPCSNSTPGEAGTLYLTDASFFPREVCAGGGRVYYANPPSKIELDSLTVKTSTLEFLQDFPIVISGDLTVKEKGDFIIRRSLVSVGGNVLVKGVSSAVDGATNLEVADFGKLVVGGDFGLETYGYLRTDAGVTNETSGVWGADLAVKGNVTLSANTAWYPCSHPTNLAVGAARMTAHGVTVATSAAINGNATGWQLPYYSSPVLPGNGFGGSYFTGEVDNDKILPAASHAGQGGSNKREPGTKGGRYGNAKMPLLPGSSGVYGASEPNKRGASGGGQVWIEARQSVTVDGEISMNGGQSLAYGGSGSGGSVFIRASQVVGSGSISAKGGKVSDTVMSLGSHWSNPAGGGGGGYVTFRTNVDLPVGQTFEGTISVDGGLARTSGTYNEETGRYATDYRGWPGVVTYLKNSGFAILIR